MTTLTINSQNAKSKHSRSRLNPSSLKRETCGSFRRKRDMANTKCAPISKRRDVRVLTLSFATRSANTFFAVEYTLMRETTSDGQTVVTETMKVTRKTYSQNWKAYNYAQTHEKSELQALLYELCKNVPEPEKRKGRGRPPLSLSDMIFSTYQNLFDGIRSPLCNGSARSKTTWLSLALAALQQCL